MLGWRLGCLAVGTGFSKFWASNIKIWEPNISHKLDNYFLDLKFCFLRFFKLLENLIWNVKLHYEKIFQKRKRKITFQKDLSKM